MTEPENWDGVPNPWRGPFVVSRKMYDLAVSQGMDPDLMVPVDSPPKGRMRGTTPIPLPMDEVDWDALAVDPDDPSTWKPNTEREAR